MVAVLMAEAGTLEIKQGATFEAEVTYLQPDGTPVNLTGWTARSQMRKHAGHPAVLAEFTVTIVDAVAGKMRLSLTAAQTTNIWSSGVYDVELVNGAVVDRLVGGAVTVSPGVTLP